MDNSGREGASKDKQKLGDFGALLRKSDDTEGSPVRRVTGFDLRPSSKKRVSNTAATDAEAPSSAEGSTALPAGAVSSPVAAGRRQTNGQSEGALLGVVPTTKALAQKPEDNLSLPPAAGQASSEPIAATPEAAAMREHRPPPVGRALSFEVPALTSLASLERDWQQPASLPTGPDAAAAATSSAGDAASAQDSDDDSDEFADARSDGTGSVASMSFATPRGSSPPGRPRQMPFGFGGSNAPEPAGPKPVNGTAQLPEEASSDEPKDDPSEAEAGGSDGGDSAEFGGGSKETSEQAAVTIAVGVGEEPDAVFVNSDREQQAASGLESAGGEPGTEQPSMSDVRAASAVSSDTAATASEDIDEDGVEEVEAVEPLLEEPAGAREEDQVPGEEAVSSSTGDLDALEERASTTRAAETEAEPSLPHAPFANPGSPPTISAGPASSASKIMPDSPPRHSAFVTRSVPRVATSSSMASSSTGNVPQIAEAMSPAQDEHSATWRAFRKHLFVLSNAGKPVFTLHGDGSALAAFMAAMQAIISFARDRGDPLRFIRAGQQLVVFLEKGPLYLVAASSCGEGVAALAAQLHLLHAQILTILTNGIDKMFQRNARYDARKMLGGTDIVLTTLIESFNSDPSYFLQAFAPLPLAAAPRATATAALHTAVKAAGALYGVLLCGNAVVALSQPKHAPLHPHDVLLLANFVHANEAFRHSESFSPVCLPHFNPAAFLHAHIQYLHQEARICLVLLSAYPDSFYQLSEAGAGVRDELESSGVTEIIAETSGSGRLQIETIPRSAGGGSIGTTPLLHFLFKSPQLRQFVLPAFSPPVDDPDSVQDLVAAYARVHASMWGSEDEAFAAAAPTPPPPATAGHPPSSPPQNPRPPLPAVQPQRVHFRSDDTRTILAYSGADYELYAAFDALTDKATAAQTSHRLVGWLKSVQDDMFVPL